MDKARLIARKPGKAKAPPSGDFIPLGTKNEGKLSGVSGGSAAGSLAGGAAISRKSVLSGSSAAATGAMPVSRVSPAASGIQPKKPKLLTPLGRGPSEIERRGSPLTQVYLYEEMARDVDPHDFLDAIEEAEHSGEEESIERVMCGAVKYLRANRAKPEPAMYLGLLYLAKTRVQLFASEVVTEAMCSLLKRDVAMSYKAKGNPLIPVLTCNALMAAFLEEDNWPDAFVKVYLEDSLGERVWVDRADCKIFVDNIQSAFNTKMPKIASSENKPGELPGSAGASPAHMSIDEEDSDLSKVTSAAAAFLEDVTGLVYPRYNFEQVLIENHVLDAIRDQLNRRQPMDGALRNTVRLMMATSGYPEVRNMAVQRLEMWLQNPKLSKHSQDLLMSVCMNCDQHSNQDIEVISQISKIRLKNKHILTHYMLCIRELIAQHPSNLHTLMTHTIYNELSQSRNPNNMAMLSTMFSHAPEKAAKTLALIFQELLCNKDDYLRALRALFREIVRSVRQDMHFTEFALGLMEEPPEAKLKDLDAAAKERLLFALTDLVCLTAYMSISPAVREAAAAVARGDSKDLETVQQFQQNVAVIQRDAIWWLHTIVSKIMTVDAKQYVFCMRKALFLESVETYHKVDNWPPDGDRVLLLRLLFEVPVLEDTLMRVLVIGLTRELRVNPADSIDIAEQLVRRAAVITSDDLPVMHVERLELIDALFHLSTYKHPDNVAFPKGYKPPTMAISKLYWKAWLILLIISAFNPKVFGQAAWDSYPTLRALMEMCMTSNYAFPPTTMGSDEKSLDEVRTQEIQAAEEEKQSILEFEGYLAAGSRKEGITDVNSLLLKSLTSLEPGGLARKPPQEVLESLKPMNQHMKLGQLLCRSREPDFLMDIIKRQGSSQSMPWLADLVEGSESSLDILPVQCLCEFLLLDNSAEATDDNGKGETSKGKGRPRKQEQLLSRLQGLLHSPASETRTVMEMLDYFLHRLSSQQPGQRQHAVRGLSLVLTKSHLELSHFDIDEEDEGQMEVDSPHMKFLLPKHGWLLQQLPALPQFTDVRTNVCAALRKACEVETDAASVSAYVIFLSEHSTHLVLQEMDSLLLDLAQLIVERATLMNHILPQDGLRSDRGDYVLAAMVDLFYGYLKKAQQPPDETYSWSNTQDQILLQWKSGESATMNILVVHAMVILLTYNCPKVASRFLDLLDCWFPEKDDPPSAFLVDTSEEALLLPDWLKLRMIRSANQRLVDAALQDLEPSQLLLFVQSFGIPVQSMSKLLSYLDRAVDVDCLSLEQVVVDKNYMAQLVEVQHMRGAQGGDKFTDMLMQGQKQQPDMTEVEVTLRPQVRRTESQLLVTPELPPFVYKDHTQMMDMITKMFDNDIAASERSHVFRSLQKTMSREKIHPMLVSCLKKLVKSSQGRPLVQNMKKNLHISCPLFRMIASKGVTDRKFGELLHLLKNALGDSKSALTTLVTELLCQNKGQGHREKVRGHLEQRMQEGRTSLCDVIKEAHSSASRSLNSESSEAESLINVCVRRSLKSRGDVTAVTETLCHCLIGDTTQGMLQTSTTGLLVDWLSLLDPETVSTCAELQSQLLFAQGTSPSLQQPVGTSQHEGSDRVAMTLDSCQSYLLVLLVHQSNWSTLRSMLTMLLKDEKTVRRYSASRALDFLWACLHIPTLWKGRERKLPKNYSLENVLGLTEIQVKLVASYIVKEAFEMNQSSPSRQYHSLSPPACDVITKRIGLLTKCCYSNEQLLRAVVQNLGHKMREHHPTSSVCRQLLLELYLQLPLVSSYLDKDVDLPQEIPASLRSASQLDTLTHRLINSMSDVTMGKKSQCKMYDANIACRKLASQHPTLVLRQMPLLASILKGRACYTFGEMKHRNHLFLFTHILGMLELLQPYLFHAEYEKVLGDVLDCFFEMVKLHSLESRQIASLVTKFIKLLHNFQCADATLASRVLHKHKEILQALTKVFPDLAILRSLLAGLVVPRHDEKSEVSPLPPPPRPPSPWSAAQLAPFLQKISKGNNIDDVMSVLSDLDETSKRKVEIIDHFLSDLKRLMLDEHENVRNITFVLIMRHLRQYPSDTGQFVAPFLRCLGHHNVDIVKTALNNMAEFIVLAREEAVVLLQKAFDIAITSKVDTANFLTESLQLLNMETML